MEFDYEVPSILNENEIYLRSLKNLSSQNPETASHINTFVRIKWTPPVLNLLDKYPMPPITKRPITPPMDSPYRMNFRPKQEVKPMPSPSKRAKRKIKDILLELETLEEVNRKSKEIIKEVDPNKYHLQQQRPSKKKKQGQLADELINLIIPQQCNPQETVALSMSLNENDYSLWRKEIMNLEISLKDDLNKHVNVPELDLTTIETYKIPLINNNQIIDNETKSLKRSKSPSSSSMSPVSKKRIKKGEESTIQSIPIDPIKSVLSSDISHLELYNTINTFWERHPQHKIEKNNFGTNLIDALNIKAAPIELSEEMKEATIKVLDNTGSGFWNDEIGSTLARPLSATLYCNRKLQELRPETAPKYPIPQEDIYLNTTKSPKVFQEKGIQLPSNYKKNQKEQGKKNIQYNLNQDELMKMQLFRFSKEAHQSAFKIQKLARRRGYLKFLSCVKIQKIWRGFLQVRKFKVIILERNAAATDIQRVIRGHFGRLRAKNWHEISRHLAAAKIQALYRGRKTRAWVKVYKYERQTMMAERIQRYYRCYIAKKKLRFLKNQRDTKCANKIQKVYRGHRARTFYRKYKKKAIGAIIMIQRNWRGKMGRLMYKLAREQRRNTKASQIQRRYRKHLEAVAKKRERMSLLIQRFYRGYKGRIKAKKLRAYLIAQENKRRIAEEKFINSQVDRANTRIRAFLDSAQGKGVVKIEKKVAYERRKKLNSIINTLSPEHQKEIQIREAFHMFDEDGSGSIDRDEFNNVTKELATPMSKDELNQAIKTIDLDGSGDIDYYEFKHWFNLQSKQSHSGARMAIMIAALKGRKLVLDMMGTTDERMAKKVLIVREIEKERINAIKAFREKHPARFICPKCKIPLTFVNEIEIHFKKKQCRVLLEEENSDPIIDEFFKVKIKSEEDEKNEKELVEKANKEKIDKLSTKSTDLKSTLSSSPPISPVTNNKPIVVTNGPSTVLNNILSTFKWNTKK